MPGIGADRNCTPRRALLGGRACKTLRKLRKQAAIKTSARIEQAIQNLESAIENAIQCAKEARAVLDKNYD